MDDLFGTALSDRHVERVEHQLGTKMMSHGPPHYLAAEHVEHDSQVHEPRPGRHVRYIRYPDPVPCIGPKLALHSVRSRSVAVIHTRGAGAPAPTDPGQAGLVHQTCHPLAAYPQAAGGQLRMHPRHPVGASGSLVDRPDRPAQLLVAPPTNRPPSASPRVVPAGGDAQHPAHRGHPMIGLVCLHEIEDLPGTVPVSRANQAAAFFRISRSSRSWRFSRRSRRNSSRSVVVKPSSRSPSSRSACRTQLRIAEAEHSNSRASSPGVRPPRTSFTICCRYSAAYDGYFFDIRTPPAHSLGVHQIGSTPCS